MMKMHQTDLDLEQRVWQRVSGGEKPGLEPLLRQAETEAAGLRYLYRTRGGAGLQKLVSAAAANADALRGLVILDGGTPSAGQTAVPSPTGLTASLCRGSEALCRTYEAHCSKSPAFRTFYTRETEIYTGLLELLGMM